MILTPCLTLTIGLATLVANDGPWFGNGIKVGEATQTTAVVWVRLTSRPEPDWSLLPILTEGLATKESSDVSMPVNVLPGSPGQVRLTCRLHPDQQTVFVSDWVDVDPQADFTHQFRLTELEPGSSYKLQVEAKARGAAAAGATIAGNFRTAPDPQSSKPVQFIVTTCQAVRSIDSGKAGHVAYRQMLEFDPDFFVHTGDIVYYDKAPFAKSIPAARAKWNLMFAYEHQKKFHQNVSSYFMKDDHDTLKNDCWPGQKYGDITFEQGLSLFREQVCMGDTTWRTVRWGKDVQIWLTEHRDFRSSNRMPDGPEKTILGAEQKQWLKSTIDESAATWKFVICPGPIVGPDKKGKADNHSNKAFAYEGQQLRDFLSSHKNLFVICGDRHWQYCSRDVETGLIEMGCGPINDQHSFGGNPGRDELFHRYFSPKGGFLVVSAAGDQARARWVNSSQVDPESGQPLVLHAEDLATLYQVQSDR